LLQGIGYEDTYVGTMKKVLLWLNEDMQISEQRKENQIRKNIKVTERERCSSQTEVKKVD
jgi:hypothetical protein